MKKNLVFITVFISCLIAATAFGAEQGGHGGEGGTSAAAWMDFMWRCINLILFLFIIYKLAGKRIKDFFSSRREQIYSELHDLEKRKADAEKELKKVEDSIANIDQEKQEILDQARAQGEVLKQQIIEKAYEEAERIKQQAERKAKQEMQQAIDEIRAEMADKVIESAEKMITKRLTKKEHEKLIDNYLTKVVAN